MRLSIIEYHLFFGDTFFGFIQINPEIYGGDDPGDPGQKLGTPVSLRNP